MINRKIKKEIRQPKWMAKFCLLYNLILIKNSHLEGRKRATNTSANDASLIDIHRYLYVNHG